MTWSNAAQTVLRSRAGYQVHWLLWAVPKVKATGDDFPIGLWTGDDHASFTVDGESRLYYGAQGGIEVPPLRTRKGTNVQSLAIGLSVSPEANALVRGYRTRGAPFELHCALYSSATNELVQVRRRFAGFIDTTPISEGASGGQDAMTLNILSSARRGTMTQTGLKSDESHQVAHPGDTIRQYSALGAVSSDPWGGKA